MEYTLQPDEHVSDGIKRIVDGKIERGIDHIDEGDDVHETVHEVRKRCKEIRAAVRLVRPVLPTYKRENVHYRDAARRISDIRDAHAAIETFDDHLRPAVEARGALDDSTLADIRATLVDRRETMTAEQDLERRLAQVRADLVEGRDRVPNLPIATEGYDAVAGGLRKSYKRARNRMGEAYEEPEFERFHEWRKRIKYHRYHTRLLRRVWVGPMKRRRAELKQLSDIIGYENDLAEFEMVMHDEELFAPATREILNEILTAKRSEFHRQGRPLGERLFAEAPDRLIDRLGAYWTATHEYDPAP
ncbi:CHAD domain-containing protein [Haloplanus rubicundus]|uniref:CHAD domain-containing protein n=1 Tax=Haloplanus rubicundus TaxID=1547898 RepID=A0A345EIC8_9EURY|nr:CHAD domain-containing protein [Haloplanus rubicundus]AXG11950.1 CHAD domain-containing protein [Haloplanus rubicundus]